MKPHRPALTSSALAVAASKKTLKARGRLRVAESELRVANELLAQAAAHPQADQVEDALQHNRLAKARVHEADEELGSAVELLDLHAEGEQSPAGLAAHHVPAGAGRSSGHGAESVLVHLREQRAKPR